MSPDTAERPSLVTASSICARVSSSATRRLHGLQLDDHELDAIHRVTSALRTCAYRAERSVPVESTASPDPAITAAAHAYRASQVLTTGIFPPPASAGSPEASTWFTGLIDEMYILVHWNLPDAATSRMIAERCASVFECASRLLLAPLTRPGDTIIGAPGRTA